MRHCCICQSENVKLFNVLVECIVSSKLLFNIDLKDLKLFVSHRGTNNSIEEPLHIPRENPDKNLRKGAKMM